MNETTFEMTLKALIATVTSAVIMYFNMLIVPFIVLMLVMTVDYITGMAQAYISHTLNSRIGIIGIIKKVGYVMLVACGIVADYLISSGLSQCGINIKISYCIALIIIMWLIINELISILENLSEIGIPLPKFFVKLIKRLKTTVESVTDDED